MLSSYPKVYNLGHRSIANLFSSAVVVQEKIDGSQFSWGLVDGELEMRSKGADIHPETTDKLFSGAVQTVLGLTDKLEEGFVYRGEVLARPRHNTLCYGRVPDGNIILFDISLPGEEYYATPEQVRQQGAYLGLEVVPQLDAGIINSWEYLKNHLDRDSILGGTKVEGVVVKNYDVFSMDGKVAMGKYVSEEFKEVHNKSWKERNPGQSDFTARVVERYKTTARWEKAVQHLREQGLIMDTPQDIGKLLVEVQKDVHEECAADIAELLFKHYWKDIGRGITAGLPDWYKERLAEAAF